MPALKVASAPRKRFSSIAAKFHVLSVEQRAALRRELKEANAMQREMEEKEKERRRELAQRARDRATYKKEQELRNAMRHRQGVQIMSNPHKVKKMNPKLRKQLIHMPPELLQEFFKK